MLPNPTLICIFSQLEVWVREIKLHQLRQQLAVGFEQLDAGEGVHIRNTAELDHFFEEIKTHQCDA